MAKFFEKEINRLTFAAILVLVAFPLLYIGASKASVGLSIVGMIVLLVGLSLEPVYSFIHKRK